MTSLDLLGAALHAFAWILVLVLSFVAILALSFPAPFGLVARESYEGLDDEEIVVIEEARAELARRARERAEKARASALSARFDALSSLAFYQAVWEIPDGSWESLAISRIREMDIANLVELPGVGPMRARRIVDAGEGLSLDLLRKIVTGPRLDPVLRAV